MPVDPTVLGPKVADRRASWEALDADWSVDPVGGYPSNPMVAAHVEGAGCLAQVSVWVSGDAELETIRTADGCVVNKHYDLESVDDVDTILDDLIRLLRAGTMPHGAVLGQA